MPERKIPFLPDHYYHIYNRGNNRGTIFFEEENYLFFLRRWRKYLDTLVDVLAYCLMPTHYHFLVRVKPGIYKDQNSEFSKNSEFSMSKSSEFSGGDISNISPISRGMQKIGISYTRAINIRFERVGSLFQGAFQAKLIESEKHLLHLCRYIHANPVKDGLVDLPEGWPYSNYLEWIGQRDGTLFDRDFVEDNFPNRGEYILFVNDFVETRRLPEEILGYLSEFE